jgi:uncharacterized protein (TIGR02246 family)
LLSFDVVAQPNDETGIKQAVQNMQDGWNKKDGALFASAFAPEHDYVVINGMFLTKVTREKNAQMHQQLFDGMYKEVDIALRVSKIRFLNSGIAVIHIQGHSHPKGQPDQKRQEIIITLVMQKPAAKWEIVAFHNSPVEPREERKGG